MSAQDGYVRPADVDRRSSFRQRFAWRLETLAWDLLYWAPVKRMSPEGASNFGAWLARRIGPRLGQHETAVKNIRLAFPEWTEERVLTTAMDAWESAGRTAGELPHLPKIDPYSSGRVEVIGANRLDEIRESGRGAVLVSGHFANWEVMAAAICKRPLDCLVTYRALNNPGVDRRLNAARRAYGVNVLAPKGLATRDLMRALAAGRSVALLNDQKFNQGAPMRFFGHDAMTAPGPSRLAVRYGVPMLPVSTRRIGPARFRVMFHAPLFPPDDLDGEAAALALTQKITDFVEAEVRANPGQWFWFHRRWPKAAWTASWL